jgi:hypothetical protein
MPTNYRKLKKGGPPLFRPGRRPKKHFPLLDSPREIRESVLRELLYSSEPLKYRDAEHVVIRHDQLSRITTNKRNYNLYPEILRTCKQLHEEGTPILHRLNTVGIDIWCGLGELTYASCMGNKPSPGFYWDRELSGSCQQMCKTSNGIQISLHLQRQEWMLSDDSFEYRIDVSEVCEELVGQKEIEKCRFEVLYSGPPQQYTQDNEIGERILDTLAMLRPREVSITGFSPDYATKIERAMLSTEPAANLYAMRGALADYLKPTHGDKYINMLEWHAVDDALWIGDYPAFKEARDAIVKRIEEEREELKPKLYEHEVDVGTAGQD